jgi:heparanase
MGLGRRPAAVRLHPHAWQQDRCGRAEQRAEHAAADLRSDVFARDIATLRALIDSASPTTLLVGPASTGEAGFKLFDVPPEIATTTRLLSGTPTPQFDVFSHHFYGAVSQRCKSLGERPGMRRDVNTSAADALSESWLSRADQAQTYYKRMRDRFAPGKPIWITETAQTACGGDPWSSTFLDTFRYVDQLGRLAKQDVSIVFHNTLAASDYALIDDRTWLPRPNYWAALLWRRLMGETVLEAGHNRSDLHVYAHCLRGRPSGVALIAVNLSRTSTAQLDLPTRAKRYTLTSEVLESDTVKLNGKVLALTAGDRLPRISGASTRKGKLVLPAASVTFLEIPDAGNQSCT